MPGAAINSAKFYSIDVSWDMRLFWNITHVPIYTLKESNILNYLWMVLIMKSWVPFFVWVVAGNTLIGCRDWFGDILNLLNNIDLLLYAEPLTFLVISINIYGSIFYQVYLIPWITILFSKLVLYNSGDVVVSFWVTSTSLSGYPQVFYGWLNETLLY